MIKKNFKKHHWFYISFVLIQIVGGLLVYVSSFDKKVQLTAVFLLTVLSVFWSLMHQHIHHHLSSKIVLEYVLMGGIGIVFAFIFF
jgi:hypothetical protein